MSLFKPQGLGGRRDITTAKHDAESVVMLGPIFRLIAPGMDALDDGADATMMEGHCVTFAMGRH